MARDTIPQVTDNGVESVVPPAGTDHYRFEEHGGHTILVVDYRESDPALLLERVRAVKKFILSQPPGSVLQMTIVQDEPYPNDWMHAIIEAMRVQKSHMRASAVVGLRRLKPVVNAVNRLAGRKVRAFHDEESATRWLLEESEGWR
jgi:hypothetical protein